VKFIRINSLSGPHENYDIFKVIGSKVKVTDWHHC